MSWRLHTSAYCERVGPGLLAEPLNLFSNLAFTLAAWKIGRLAVRRFGREIPPALVLLVALAHAVGIGSALFHSFATPWAQRCDVGSIAAYLVAYLYLALRRLFGATRRQAGVGVLGFLAGSALLAWLVPAGALHGSEAYLGALLTLDLITRGCARRQPSLARFYRLARLAFAAALVFRTLDAWVCPWWPWGTHFLWHALNGVVVYATLRAALHLWPAGSSR